MFRFQSEQTCYIPKNFSDLAFIGFNAVYTDKSHNEVDCADTNNIVIF